MKRDGNSGPDIFSPRRPEVRPLVERGGRLTGDEPLAAGGAGGPSSSSSSVRSLFVPPPAEPPPPPPPPAQDPEVQRQVEELLEQAELAGLQNAERKVQAMLERYADAIRRMDERFLNVRPQASEVVSLAMVVAREILGRELRVDGEPLITALDEALRQVGTHPTIVVRLCRKDLEYVKLRRADLLASGIELLLDDSLGPGGCVVEAPDQIVDASIEARLHAARDAVAAAIDRDGRDGRDGRDDRDGDGASGEAQDDDLKVVA